MSSPLKQVSGRRLPPISSKGGNTSNASSNHSVDRTNRQNISKSAGAGSCCGGPLSSPLSRYQQKDSSENKKTSPRNNHRNHQVEIENVFEQGPFRSPLLDFKHGLAGLAPPPVKESESDPSIFLHGMLLVLLLLVVLVSSRN